MINVLPPPNSGRPLMGTGNTHRRQIMKKPFIWTAFMFMALAVPAAAQPFFPVTHIPTVQVAGEGSVSVAPDRARLMMRVSEIRPSVADAKAAVDRMGMQIQKMLTETGIEKSQINASELLIQRVDRVPLPQGQRKETYHVSRQITVIIADIAKLDTVLDRSVSLGTNEIWQVELYSSREQDLKLEAMRLAARDARRKAETLADEFNRVLGKVHMAEHEFGGSSPVYRMALQEHGAAAEFSRGTLRIEARVAVVYELQ
ncbi:MAG: DUF541 domain-containing protein [Desulfobacteraceae bacterium]|nr:MAG: DUF541 domain-containing protein [Desulfobacteraceae bacterium]